MVLDNESGLTASLHQSDARAMEEQLAGLHAS